jgi:hypothetical protein
MVDCRVPDADKSSTLSPIASQAGETSITAAGLLQSSSYPKRVVQLQSLAEGHLTPMPFQAMVRGRAKVALGRALGMKKMPQ